MDIGSSKQFSSCTVADKVVSLAREFDAMFKPPIGGRAMADAFISIDG